VIAGAACYRKWEPVQLETEQEPPELLAVVHARNFGVNFSTRKEEYITCWFRTHRESVAREQLRFEVGGFGVPALFVRHEEDGAWLANFRLPPGLEGGWNAVRLRFPDTGFGRTLRIAVDMPLKIDRLVLKGVCDGITWSGDEITIRERGFISLWVNGLPENADRSNICVRLGDARLEVEYFGGPDSDGCRQINVGVPGDVAEGEQFLRTECGGVSSEPCISSIFRGDHGDSQDAPSFRSFARC
jgi:hypothetical protein